MFRVSDCSPATRNKESEIRVAEAKRDFYKENIDKMDDNFAEQVTLATFCPF